MTRRAFLTLPAVVATQNTVKGFHLTGPITGEHVEGGYFEIGQEFVMATPIRSPLYPRLKELVGVNVEVTVHPV